MLKAEEAGYRLTTCVDCKSKIILAKRTDRASSFIPLDPKAPVFEVRGLAKKVENYTDRTEADFLVSHFSTCIAKTRAWRLLLKSLMELARLDGSKELRAEISKYIAREV